MHLIVLVGMSTWLSGGLNQFSNITDQISSFTKEVLTETTEEVTGLFTFSWLLGS